ncbi:hypothetical protein IB267_04595 [Ensifer sp. ENS09]|uniref:hypothetical protein n=1 Tax=Ensifer sp. ENS09 TaxID=2769263 RepID=UPI00178422EA|nr:hypothetical protein [Ensifer sp. ENS09]MBD9647629.1 hypothetical protein [Ensifer sp. ENS09]
MPARALRDRYKSPLLQPDENSRHAHLVELLAADGVSGAVVHVLKHVSEQGEDIYTLLVDDRLVASFEVPRDGISAAIAFRVSPLARYRHEIGQGKSRMRLDRAVEDARKLLAQ